MAINGKVDTFKYWFLPRKARKLLDQYQAPRVESAIAKQIPIKGNEDTIEQLVRLLKLKRRFRGTRSHPRDARPSYRRNQDCVKEFAQRVSLYPRQWLVQNHTTRIPIADLIGSRGNKWPKGDSPKNDSNDSMISLSRARQKQKHWLEHWK